jgi:hypothetical protein
MHGVAAINEGLVVAGVEHSYGADALAWQRGAAVIASA